MRADGHREGAVDAGDLLDDARVRGHAEAGAAVRLRDGEPEEAELLKPGEHLGRDRLLAVDPAPSRRVSHAKRRKPSRMALISSASLRDGSGNGKIRPSVGEPTNRLLAKDSSPVHDGVGTGRPGLPEGGGGAMRLESTVGRLRGQKGADCVTVATRRR